jgi:phospholipid/cholesterol/gamma-HCH transport system substrate-binding protein
MNERTMQFRVGVMILATILIAAILVLMTMESGPLMRGTYAIRVKFDKAPGVADGTPVRKAGITIGRVSDVQLADDDRGVIVTAQIEKDRRLYSDEQCKAVSALLMGDAALEFVRIDNFQGDRVPVEPGATLTGSMAADMTGSLAGMQQQAAQTLDTLNTAGRDVDRLANRVDHLVEANQQQITHMISQADEMMQLARQALVASNDLLGDPKLRADIKETIAKMPAILEETRTTVARMSGTFASLEKNMQNIEGLTKPLGERGPTLVAELDSSMKKLDLLSDNMLQFSQELNDPKGSLGALLHDKELYQHVNSMARNLEELSRDLKPILDNVGIATDKVARHPELLGVSGALKKGSGLKEAPANDDFETDYPEPSRRPLSGSGGFSFGGQ